MDVNRNHIWLKAALLGLAMAACLLSFIIFLKPTEQQSSSNEHENNVETLYEVKSVLDGDTIKIEYDGKETSVRFIGVNTPETIDPRSEVECFGQEASDYLKGLLTRKKVKIEADPSQSDRDKYDRLLRYVYLDGEDVGYKIISNGYGYEYTYNTPYVKQEIYKNAQDAADKNRIGLWAENACRVVDGNTDSDSDANTITNTQNTDSNSADCNIKGNINYNGEKIYHIPGQKYYNSTKIDTEYGERWFCSEEEAQAAGWRKSKV